MSFSHVTQHSLRIIQISDCHIAARADQSYRGIDARANLESLLPNVLDWAPRLVLATGDLSEDGSESSYRWLWGRLEALEVPILALPGNHDDHATMKRWFPACAGEEPLIHRCGPWRLVLLDSSEPGEIAGRLGSDLLTRLNECLSGGDRYTLIALHHQPVSVGSEWIDRYPLREPERLWAVLRGHAGVRTVIWGHVHQAVDRKVHSIRALGAPSTASNSLPNRDRFTPDPKGPACRWLELMPDGAVRTGLLRP